MTSLLPELRKRVYYTTARVIHPVPETGQQDWLWTSDKEFSSLEDAKQRADLANINAKESGQNTKDYPYFPVKVIRSSLIQVATDE